MARALGSFQQGASPSAPARRKTKEEQAYTQASDNIEKMKKECVKYENPDDYAKYGKMQRQILKLEKELKKLKEAADQSQLREPEPGEEIEQDEPAIIEEANNAEESVQPSQSS